MKSVAVIKFCLFTGLYIFSFLSYATQKKEIALTIDDLPFVGESKKFHLNLIIKALKTNAIPATGFIIAKEVTPKNWPILQKFHDAGLGLGNHTYSHVNLNRVSSHAYIREIEAADRILSPVLTHPKYFRYPYLAMSQGDKKNKVLNFLSSREYRVAPITIDSKDFLFNQILYSIPENHRRAFLSTLKDCYLGFLWQQTLKAEEHNRLAHKPEQAHILLIHANLLNAYLLPDIIKLYQEHGFNFVSLEKALKTFANASEKKLFPVSREQENEYLEWDN